VPTFAFRQALEQAQTQALTIVELWSSRLYDAGATPR
jgi:hypothetical protein